MSKVTSGDHESQAEERNVPEISFSDLKFGDKLEEGGFCKGHWQSKDMDVSIKRVPGKLHKEEVRYLYSYSLYATCAWWHLITCNFIQIPVGLSQCQP